MSLIICNWDQVELNLASCIAPSS